MSTIRLIGRPVVFFGDMAGVTLQTLGRLLAEQRGSRGVREVAKEIGISHSTLSRVERGFLPDLDTFGKICKWLNVDPGEILGVKPATENQTPEVFGHFKKDQTMSVSTAQALAQMILAAQQALIASEEGRK
jgi:transcriptional regulator with XRE-family HTH domain